MAVQKYFGDISSRVQENLAGVRVVRAFTREENEIDRFKQMNHEFVDLNRSLIRLNAAFHPTLHTLVGVVFVYIFYAGSLKIIGGTMTIGAFVPSSSSRRMIWPLIAIGWVINLFQRGMASMKRLHEVLSVDASSSVPSSSFLEVAPLRGTARTPRHRGTPRNPQSHVLLRARPVLRRSISRGARPDYRHRRPYRQRQVDASAPPRARSSRRRDDLHRRPSIETIRCASCANGSAWCRRRPPLSESIAENTASAVRTPPMRGHEAAIMPASPRRGHLLGWSAHDHRRARHYPLGRPEAAPAIARALVRDP